MLEGAKKITLIIVFCFVTFQLIIDQKKKKTHTHTPRCGSLSDCDRAHLNNKFTSQYKKYNILHSDLFNQSGNEI